MFLIAAVLVGALLLSAPAAVASEPPGSAALAPPAPASTTQTQPDPAVPVVAAKPSGPAAYDDKPAAATSPTDPSSGGAVSAYAKAADEHKAAPTASAVVPAPVGVDPVTPPSPATPVEPDKAATDAGRKAATDAGRKAPTEDDKAAPPKRPSQLIDTHGSSPAEGSDGDARATNRSITIQVIEQVQRGCRRHCYGTSQSQSAIQTAQASQTAVAVAAAEKGSGSGQAVATNQSRTVQFVWQRQIGCVAFCYGTAQSQSAVQGAETLQSALALAFGDALAANASSTAQVVWQVQSGCRRECHGTSQSQSLHQAELTRQAAGAVSAAGRAAARAGRTHKPRRRRGGTSFRSLMAALQAWAGNSGVTIQVVRQVQEAACTRYCSGDSQSQLAVQQARIAQSAAAGALGRREDDGDKVSA